MPLRMPGAPTVACALCLLCLAATAPAYGRGWGPPPRDPQGAPGYSATLEQCVSSTVPAERSVTFTGQMVAIPGTWRMGMRIDLEQRAPGESAFHTVLAQGLGVWRGSEPGVKIYKYVKQITDLAAPAAYRAVVRFRWLGERGHMLKRAQLRTARCVQPPQPVPEAQSGNGAPAGR